MLTVSRTVGLVNSTAPNALGITVLALRFDTHERTPVSLVEEIVTGLRTPQEEFWSIDVRCLTLTVIVTES